MSTFVFHHLFIKGRKQRCVASQRGNVRFSLCVSHQECRLCYKRIKWIFWVSRVSVCTQSIQYHQSAFYILLSESLYSFQWSWTSRWLSEMLQKNPDHDCSSFHWIAWSSDTWMGLIDSCSFKLSCLFPSVSTAINLVEKNRKEAARSWLMGHLLTVPVRKLLAS